MHRHRDLRTWLRHMPPGMLVVLPDLLFPFINLQVLCTIGSSRNDLFVLQALLALTLTRHAYDVLPTLSYLATSSVSAMLLVSVVWCNDAFRPPDQTTQEEGQGIIIIHEQKAAVVHAGYAEMGTYDIFPDIKPPARACERESCCQEDFSARHPKLSARVSSSNSNSNMLKQHVDILCLSVLQWHMKARGRR